MHIFFLIVFIHSTMEAIKLTALHFAYLTRTYEVFYLNFTENEKSEESNKKFWVKLLVVVRGCS